MKSQLLIPAAGMGARLGAQGPKALVDLCGRPMLVRTLERFDEIGLARDAVVVIPGEHEPVFRRTLEAHGWSSVRLARGGAERQDSVGNGLDALDPMTEIVAIHDAARPFPPLEAVQRALDAAAECGAATIAVPCVDTILLGDEEGWLVDTPDRRRTWACQTPQVFRVEVIREAHRRAREEGAAATDDATMARRVGGAVKLIEGSRMNRKITTPDDLEWARFVLEREAV